MNPFLLGLMIGLALGILIGELAAYQRSERGDNRVILFIASLLFLLIGTFSLIAGYYLLNKGG